MTYETAHKAADLASAFSSGSAQAAVGANLSSSPTPIPPAMGGPRGATAVLPPHSNVNQGFLVAATRTVGRMSAASISSKERNELLEERQRLLDKKLSDKITRSEANCLSYVRWMLDRIEDARSGPVLDEIEAKLFEYERLARDIASLKDILHSTVRSRNRS